MTINSIVTKELFEIYGKISNRVKEIQNMNISRDEQKKLMSELKVEFAPKTVKYTEVITKYAKQFNEKYKLNDHVITPNIGSPTPYGYQPKDYLWSGISILPEKSFSFQYSWVIQKDVMEITFSFGSGGFSTNNVDEAKKTKLLNNLSILTDNYIKLLEIEKNKTIIKDLFKNGFVFTLSWLEANNNNKIIRDIEEYIEHIKKNGAAKSGLTLYIKPEDLRENYNLDEKLHNYFNIFYPIWEQLHNNFKTDESIDTTLLDNEDIFVNVIGDDVNKAIKYIKDYIVFKGFSYPENLIENFYLSLKSKPFVILAGISGTGKTQLVKLFAEALGANGDNGQYKLIPVRPDWNDPSDLIGYKDLSGKFQPGILTQVLLEAVNPANKYKPYFICLDEMNLARVEHYFSDILSLLETTEWRDGEIVSEKLISENSLLTEDKQKFGSLCIPENVYIIGTVNMDETTYPFSKKVLDRANTIEFNYIDLNSFPNKNSEIENIAKLNIKNDFLKSQYIKLNDMYSQYEDIVHETTEKLVEINKIIEPIHAHIGFRIRDTICFYMSYNSDFKLMSPNNAFDLQILQKILPRIQGSNQAVREVLLNLFVFVAPSIKGNIKGLLNGDIDIYKWYEGNKDNTANILYTQTAKKLLYMLRRLDEDGFTSYWIS